MRVIVYTGMPPLDQRLKAPQVHQALFHEEMVWVVRPAPEFLRQFETEDDAFVALHARLPAWAHNIIECDDSILPDRQAGPRTAWRLHHGTVVIRPP